MPCSGGMLAGGTCADCTAGRPASADESRRRQDRQAAHRAQSCTYRRTCSAQPSTCKAVGRSSKQKSRAVALPLCDLSFLTCSRETELQRGHAAVHHPSRLRERQQGNSAQHLGCSPDLPHAC